MIAMDVLPRMPPASTVYYTNVESIPLVLCCVSGTAIVVNFVQCVYNCAFCPWDANLNARSARIVKVEADGILSAVERYKPDVLFLNGGTPWEYDISKEILKSVQGLDVLKGVKVLTGFSDMQSYARMLEIADICDVLLVEVSRYTAFEVLFDIVDKSFGKKHMEIVVVDDDDVLGDKLALVIKKLAEDCLYVPISVISSNKKEAHKYKYIDILRKTYPLINMPCARSSEYSSILCPKCFMPIVARSGKAVLKVSLDDECKCVYCGYKVISTEKKVCKPKRMVKIPINVPLV